MDDRRRDDKVQLIDSFYVQVIETKYELLRDLITEISEKEKES